jgi:hypothetical protein
MRDDGALALLVSQVDSIGQGLTSFTLARQGFSGDSVMSRGGSNDTSGLPVWRARQGQHGSHHLRDVMMPSQLRT